MAEHLLRLFRSRRSRRRRRPSRRWSRTDLAIATLFGIGGVALIGMLVRSVERHDALLEWRQTLNATVAAPHWPTWDPRWPSLPDRRGATVGDLEGLYAYAARHPDVLRAIPCYCGCARLGHRSNLSCYVRGFTSAGQPMWDDHTFTCPMCAAITREVSLMLQQGRSVAEARVAIDAVYKPLYRTGTPTPPPHAH